MDSALKGATRKSDGRQIPWIMPVQNACRQARPVLHATKKRYSRAESLSNVCPEICPPCTLSRPKSTLRIELYLSIICLNKQELMLRRQSSANILETVVNMTVNSASLRSPARYFLLVIHA
jgi:hypothetical protein